jgi:hypothetical protein
MNSLTLCLITKGRLDYLEPLIASFDRLLKYPQIHFMLILNGTPNEVTDRFNLWARDCPNKVSITHFQENDARLSTFLPVVQKLETTWICFPSDDDLLDESFFKNWEDFIENFKDCDAIATCMDLIDSKGQSLGIRKVPSYDSSLPIEERVAKSISECPFLWPGLIIKVNRLPKVIPPTRYVSDWWIGLYLILGSRVQVVKESFTQYRVHDEQESSVSSLSRKNLESLIHLGSLIQSNQFRQWIKRLEVNQAVNFLESFMIYPPLYGDAKFSSEFVSIVVQNVCDSRDELEIQSAAKLVNAFYHGVLIDENQAIYLQETPAKVLYGKTRFNVRFEFSLSSCLAVRSVQQLIQDTSTRFPTVSVGCLHTGKNVANIQIDCTVSRSSSQILDLIAQEATSYFQKLGVFEGSVSRFEYSIVLKLRKLKKMIPPLINKIMYRIFR